MPDDTGSSEILAYSVYWREDGSSRYGVGVVVVRWVLVFPCEEPLILRTLSERNIVLFIGVTFNLC